MDSQERRIRENLAKHYDLMNKYIGEGMSPKAASEKAYNEMVRPAAKPADRDAAAERIMREVLDVEHTDERGWRELKITAIRRAIEQAWEAGYQNGCREAR